LQARVERIDFLKHAVTLVPAEGSPNGDD
jgi:hypothetical protein